jgi:UDP-N-acetylmuramoyl-tripeptide--D-alanyl-D-alanine ligase
VNTEIVYELCVFLLFMKTEQLYKLFKESSGVSTDTRTLKKGEIFIALWGDKFNGNKFAMEALEKGASIAVIDDTAFETERTMLVDDCLFELQALAAYHRKEMKSSVLAITGTNGKTTTKELLASILSKKLKVHYTRGNLNNHIGVPLTILSTPPGTEMMIIEMGASHISEIRTLCHIAKPDYGIITNIGTAHLDGFGSLEGVIRSKTELFEYLRKVNGVAIYDDKNPILAEKIFKIVNRAVPLSFPTGVELLVESVQSDLKLKIKATYQKKTYNISTNLFGGYNLENVKAAIAIGLFMDIEMKDIVDSVENYYPANNRSEIKTSKFNTLICDSYNANPTSMALAIKSFAEINALNKIYILGDMLELGERSQDEHARILQMLKSDKNEKVILVGPQFKKVAENYGFTSFSNVGQLADFLKSDPIKESTILIKGSRGMTLEKIYQLL